MAKLSSHLSLYIPHLLTPGPKRDQLAQIDLPELSALALLLSRSKNHIIAQQGFFERSFSLFDLLPDNVAENDLPIASVSLSALNSASKEQKIQNHPQWVYKINPVYLHPDMDQLILSADLSQQIENHEAQQICQSINDYFNDSEQDKSWKLHYFAENHFYLISQCKIEMTTTTLDKVLGLPITHQLPKGKDADYWNQTLNEIQMFLFSMPLNQKRKEQGKTPINSLWIWGGGEFPLAIKPGQENHINREWNLVYSTNYLIEDFCQFLNIPHQRLDQFKPLKESNQLLVIDELQTAYAAKDFYHWLESIENLENTLFTPLVQALKQQNIKTLQIITEDSQRFSLNIRQLNAWWKRKLPINHYLK